MAVSGLPVLAIARSGLRRIAMVLLDRKNRVRISKVVDLRRTPQAERVNAIRDRVEPLVRRENVAVLVMESPLSHGRAVPELRDTLFAIAKEENVWFQERSVARTVQFIAPGAEQEHVVGALAAEYVELGRRLRPERPTMFGNRHHARETQPLARAFVLAHAVSLEASRGALRT